MTDPRALHPEWDAFTSEIRTLAAQHHVEYLRARVEKWSPQGRGRWRCASPFRQERTPSFDVYEDGRWHDYGGGGDGGDTIAFVMKLYSLSFKDALSRLAEDFGVATWDDRKKGRGAPPEDPDTLLALWKNESLARRVFEASTYLAHLCHDALPGRVRAYLTDHYGYSDDFIDLEKVGWMPAGLWELAHDRDGEPGAFTDEELLSTGYFHQRRSGKIDASLAQRIVFPYWKDGLCRYLIGREYFAAAARAEVTIPEHDQGKYKKLPTFDRDKRPYVSPFVENVLWNEDCLRFLPPGSIVIITEGVTDAGILAMLGFPVISPVTVAFRLQDVERVIALLRRAHCKRVAILNDNDVTADGRRPGLEGAKRMAGALWKAGFEVTVGRLPKPEGVDKVDVNELVTRALQEGWAA